MDKWSRVMVISLLATAPVCLTAQDIINEFDAPGSESRGLAWDGQYL